MWCEKCNIMIPIDFLAFISFELTTINCLKFTQIIEVCSRTNEVSGWTTMSCLQKQSSLLRILQMKCYLRLKSMKCSPINFVRLQASL